jgi:predicted permease
MTVLGRLQSGMSGETVRARLSARWPSWLDATIPPQWTAAQRERYGQRRLRMLPLRGTLDTALRERFETPLLALLAISMLVLVATCVNLAHLSLTRSAARAREMSVRAALGASRARLARGAALESAIILIVGAVAAVAVAFGLDALLVRTFESASPSFSIDVTPNHRSIAFTALVSGATFALFALFPAWRAGRVDSVVLTSASYRGSGRLRGVRRIALVTQVAVTVVLVAAGALCLEAVWRLRTDPLGLSTEGVLSAQLSPLPGGYDGNTAGNVYYQALLDRVAGEPEIEAAALSYHAVLSDAAWSVPAGIPGGDTDVAVDQSFVTEGFFAAMKIPFVAGRTFSGREPGPGAREVVLSEATARALFGTTAVVGRTVRIGRSAVLQSAEVVGVARDAVLSSPKTRNTRVVYLSFWQFGPVVQLYPTLLARARGGTAATADALRRVVAEGGVEYVSRLRTLDDQRDMTLVQERILSRLSAMFAALGLLLAGIGLYALVGLAVTERQAEFGIRRAVGGSAGHVVSLVLRDAFGLVAAGAAVGAPLAWVTGRLGAPVLGAADGASAGSMAVAVLLVLTVALGAAWRPARRASAVDPLLALRP